MNFLRLGDGGSCARLAEAFIARDHAFFVGRSAGQGVAMEGALKLKEVSYLHAEAYSAAELKHGPLALITPETPTVVVLPRDELFNKNISTIEESRARQGRVFALTHAGEPPVTIDFAYEVPASEPELDPCC
jgi:glutamine---fructose-6-phosphate transaminase (isomerizing)